MPYLDSVIMARERAEQFESDVGADLDANKEQEDDMANDEGEHDNPDMAVKDPATSGALNDSPTDVTRSAGFRRIEVQDDGVLYAKLRSLDPEQRFVVDTAVQYARRLKMAFNQVGKNRLPEQLNLLVIGDGGTGKSHVIDVMSQLLHNTFKTSGDDPAQPYVLRLAFTGNAALLIRGQTLHSVFNLPFGNEIHSLSDKIRDLRRTQLQNLRVIIIDEISLVKSDFLYQIHFRLSRDIRQNDLPFGNVGVILCGDPLQIKPPSGSHVFQPPSNEKFNLEWSISPLWERFQPVILKTNHRHGNDRIYADICNRARVGKLTDEDKKLLNSRVFPKNSSKLPTDYLFASGTNLIVNEHNQKMLNGVAGRLYIFDAKVFGSRRTQIKPPLDSSGLIKNSPIPLKLELKVGARISLTHNIDAVDGLVNGAMGEVIGFTHHPDNSVQFVMVRFDNADSGMERRKQHNVSKFPDCTAIDRLQFEFQLRKAGSATGTAINFPLRLCWGTTLHRLQGHTIEAPQKLVLNLECWLQHAMIYVGLSRVKFLDQLFILNRLPLDKIDPFPDAFDEMTRLKTIDISLPVPKNANEFEIVSLNTRSLPAHFEDIKSDINLMSAKVLLLQETSLTPDIDVGNMYNLSGKNVGFTSQGRNKGLASYFPPDFQVISQISDARFQMTTISNSHMQITNVYRSANAGSDFLDYFDQFLSHIIDKSKMQIIMGDWNFCQRDEPNHPVKRSLDRHNFISALRPHQPTHLMGRCLDAIFVRNLVSNYDASVKVCIYSDHEPISIKFDYANDDGGDYADAECGDGDYANDDCTDYANDTCGDGDQQSVDDLMKVYDNQLDEDEIMVNHYAIGIEGADGVEDELMRMYHDTL